MGCDYRRGMDWILDLVTLLYTPLETTTNYGAIADFHALEITDTR
jgi:hypothetical protein